MSARRDRVVCAIHQPNFFPWLGYFDKIRRADVFVFLDEVQHTKTGASWTNRVSIRMGDVPLAITCPIKRPSGTQKISDVRIEDTKPWRKKFKKTLKQSYGKNIHFSAVIEVLEPLIDYKTKNIADYNVNAIMAISEVLDVSAVFLRQSDLAVEGKGTELLAAIVTKVGATEYLAGGGSQDYQEDSVFADQNINVSYQNFRPRPYGIGTSFIPGLSVIDFLMLEGVGKKT